MVMTKITISNRENNTFKVKGHKPLLEELLAQGVDLHMDVNMEDV